MSHAPPSSSSPPRRGDEPLAHAVAVVLAVIAMRARRGAFSARYHAPLTVAALYWHFVDVVWALLFALIYLPGRT